MRRRILVLFAVVAVLVGAVAIAVRLPAVEDRLLARGIEAQAGARADDLFEDDALRVLLCGTSSPFPHASRAKSCTAVFAGGRFWVVDTGNGSWNRLALWRVPGERIAGILLTHFHSDHIGALGEYDLQTWVAGRPGPLRVFGPPGVEYVVAGFEQAYTLDTGYRIAHHGAELLDPEKGRMQARRVEMPRGRRTAPVVEEDGLRITALRVDHAPVEPAYGYRFEYRGRSVVVSGDTTEKAGLEETARGADVLVHEAQADDIVEQIERVARRVGRDRIARIMADIRSYHTTPVAAAKVANAAGVKLLVLTHLTPPPAMALVERVFTRGVSEVRPDGWVLGRDGLLVELPVDSEAIELRVLD